MQNKISVFNALIICSLVILTSCFNGRQDPTIVKNNRTFLSRYGDDIQKNKKKHKLIMKAEHNVSYDKPKRIEGVETAKGINKIKGSDNSDFDYSQLKKEMVYDMPEEISLIKGNDNQTKKSYLLDKKNIIYNSNYNGQYIGDKINFDDIQIPKSDLFYNTNLGTKDFETVDNTTMQESFDYMYVINKTRQQKRKEIRSKQKKIIKYEQKTEEKKGVLSKAKDVVKGLKDRVLNLLK